MSLISLLDDSSGSIRESLSLEEIQIAFTFLRKRFPQYSIKEIVLSLSQYVLQKEYSTVDNTKQLFLRKKRDKTYANFDNFQRQNQSEQRIIKKQKLKLISKLYCQSGVKYSLVQFFYPNMTLKEYKFLLQNVMAQTLNNIEKFLKYECNVLLDQISKEVKTKVSKKLMDIKQCLGSQNLHLIETFYKFIERYYIKQDTQIQYKDALSLFKAIEEFSKNLQQQVPNFQVRRSKQTIQVGQSNCSSQEEKAIIILFKKYQSITKVSDLMCQKFGYNLKWSKHSLKHILRHILRQALQKLIQSAKIYDKKADLFFCNSQQSISILYENQNSFDLKQKLFDFYLDKSVTLHRIRQLVKRANLFFVGQYSPRQINFQDQPEIIVKLPQLKVDFQSQFLNKEAKRQKRQTQVIDLQFFCQKQCNMRNRQRRKNWIQVMEIDSDSNSNISANCYKEADTDVESMLIAEQKNTFTHKNQDANTNIQTIINIYQHKQVKIITDQQQEQKDMQDFENKDKDKEWEGMQFQK